MLSYCWKTLKLRVPCSLVKGKIILIYYNHSTPHFKKLLKRASRVTIWHHFTNLQLQWKNRAFFLVPFSSQQLYLVVSWFGVQQETNTALQSVKERDRRPSSFQMVILSDRSTLNFRHLQFKIVTWSLRFWVYLLLLYICFLNSLAQFSGGIPTATIQVRRELVYDANFKHLNFGLGCGFFCLWSLHFLCNNCTFIFYIL